MILIGKRTTFETKTGYFLKLLTPKTTNLISSSGKMINKSEKSKIYLI